MANWCIFFCLHWQVFCHPGKKPLQSSLFPFASFLTDDNFFSLRARPMVAYLHLPISCFLPLFSRWCLSVDSSLSKFDLTNQFTLLLLIRFMMFLFTWALLSTSLFFSLFVHLIFSILLQRHNLQVSPAYLWAWTKQWFAHLINFFLKFTSRFPLLSHYFIFFASAILTLISFVDLPLSVFRLPK